MRLARYGHKKMAYYRVLLGEDSKRPTGKFGEILGNYNPHNKTFNINIERVNYWLEKGAQPSATLLYLLSKDSKIKLPKWAKEQLVKSEDTHKARIERVNTAKAAEEAQAKKDLEAEQAEKAEQLQEADNSNNTVETQADSATTDIPEAISKSEEEVNSEVVDNAVAESQTKKDDKTEEASTPKAE